MSGKAAEDKLPNWNQDWPGKLLRGDFFLSSNDDPLTERSFNCFQDLQFQALVVSF